MWSKLHFQAPLKSLTEVCEQIMRYTRDSNYHIKQCRFTDNKKLIMSTIDWCRSIWSIQVSLTDTYVTSRQVTHVGTNIRMCRYVLFTTLFQQLSLDIRPNIYTYFALNSHTWFIIQCTVHARNRDYSPTLKRNQQCITTLNKIEFWQS